MSKRRVYNTLGLIAIIAFTVLVPHAVQAQSTCAPDQRKEFRFTAVDKDGNVIDKLRTEHLSLKVGGAPATISDVVFQTKYSLDLVILIDASVSQEKAIPTSKAAAQAFVASVAKQGQDSVAVATFSDKPNYIQLLTSDLSAVTKAIDQVHFEPPSGYIGGGVVMSRGQPPNPPPQPGSTSLWDAVRNTTVELFPEQSEKRRRAMLLFTDGVDTSSSSTLNALIEEAIKREVAVFSLGLADTNFGYLDERGLKKLSEQTGGVAEFPGKKTEKLEAALTEIARRFHANYVVGYCGGGAKDKAKLELEVVDPEMRKAKPVLAYKRY